MGRFVEVSEVANPLANEFAAKMVLFAMSLSFPRQQLETAMYRCAAVCSSFAGNWWNLTWSMHRRVADAWVFKGSVVGGPLREGATPLRAVSAAAEDSSIASQSARSRVVPK